MALSLKTFRDKLTDGLLQLHWQQWTTFGISSHQNLCGKFILDLEALAVSTLTIGMSDKRLFSAASEWLRSNRRWLNLNRVKRIGKLFCGSDTYRDRHLLETTVFEKYLDFLKQSKAHSAYESGKPESGNERLSEYLDMIEGYEQRDISVKPDLRHPCLLQLFLRGVFGIDARVEVPCLLSLN